MPKSKPQKSAQKKATPLAKPSKEPKKLPLPAKPIARMVPKPAPARPTPTLAPTPIPDRDTDPTEPGLHGLEVSALADSGAVHLCIPEHLALQLQLRELERREVVLADGRDGRSFSSTRIGAVRLQREFCQQDPLPVERRSFLQAYIQGALDPAVAEVKAALRRGASGWLSARALVGSAALVTAAQPAPPRPVPPVWRLTGSHSG